LLRTEELPGGSHFRAATGSKLTLDGLTFFGAALNITGGLDMLRVRHCTVSPREYPPVACAEDRTNRSLGLALHLTAPRARVEVSLSILGPCTLQRDAAKTDPVEFYLRDSIWDDGRSGSCSVFQSDMGGSAYATLTAARITVRGAIDTHAIAAADNCLFDGVVQVARRQLGCMRFCYVPLASRTPRRYHCVPDTHGQPPTDDSLRPIFVSTHFGDPGYARLAPICPDAIRRGAEDLGELGGFHDLFLSQRLSNLQTRLDEFVPAGASAGVFLTD
jgi:hypothetical protein